MATAASTSGSKPAWLWCHVNDDGEFQHPGMLAQDNVTAHDQLLKGCRGPRLARITAVSLLPVKASVPHTVTIANKGAMIDVHKSRLLPWHEGLLILQELLRHPNGEHGRLSSAWINEEHRAQLDAHRKLSRALGAAKYVEERLMDVAVTGAKYVDDGLREWSYRRTNLLTNAAKDMELSDVGEDGESDLYNIKELCRYMPPWEAFCHPKCGYYQDFYQVLWAHPYGLIDYSQCENGCDDLIGATWEPDECIPPWLDRLRVEAKRAWHAEQIVRERETKDMKGAKTDIVVEPPTKKQCVRRDGNPLARDIVRFQFGHDFVRESDKVLGNVRTGWPKCASDYPLGFGVASPPGYCKETCDCMDDQRLQTKWELRKTWDEDTLRTASVHEAIANFGGEKTFVKRHGDGKSLCYFETLEKYMYRSLQPLAKAALDLAGVFQTAVQKAAAWIPIQALRETNMPFCIPSMAFVSDGEDFCPLLVSGVLENGNELPKWLNLDTATGQLRATSDAPLAGETRLKICFKFSKTKSVDFTCAISSTLLETSPDTPWCKAVKHAMEKFGPSSKSIDPALRVVLQEQLSKVYDFKKQRPREVSVKQCLDILTRCLRMSRAASVANLTVASAGRRLP